MRKLVLLVPLILMITTVFGLTLPITVDSSSNETILNEISSLGLDIEDSLSNGNKITISCSDETINDSQICVSIPTNELLIEEIENPITLNVKLYIQEYPDIDFGNIYPVGATFVIDWTGSTPEGVAPGQPASPSDPTFINTTITSADPTQTLDLPFFYTDQDGNSFSKEYPMSLGSEEMIHVELYSSVDKIKPGEYTTFTIIGDSFGNGDLSYEFDAGQIKNYNGELVDASGSIQCKEFEREGGALDQCILSDAIYEGTPTIGAPCGCDTFAGSNSIYEGQVSDEINDSKFEIFIPVTYDSKDSCGENRDCEVSLTVTSSTGLSTTKELTLGLPEMETCDLFSNSEEDSTNQSAFVGFVEDGTISCYCELGYKPIIDTSSSLPGSNSAKKCIKDLVKTEEVIEQTTVIPSPAIPKTSNPSPYVPPAISNPNQYSSSQALESESDSNLALIFVIVIILGLLIVGGFELYEKKKTGSFVNPFSKFMKKSPKSLSNNKDSKTISPIQRFITKARTAGESNDTIRQNLKNSGWPEEEINKYL